MKGGQADGLQVGVLLHMGAWCRGKKSVRQVLMFFRSPQGLKLIASAGAIAALQFNHLTGRLGFAAGRSM